MTIDKQRLDDLIAGDIYGPEHSWETYYVHEDVFDALRELRDLRAAGEWRPIETAPDTNNPYGFFECSLRFGQENDPCTGVGFRWNDEWYAAGLFHCIGQERQFELRETRVKPTHWRPLPPPPKQEG